MTWFFHVATFLTIAFPDDKAGGSSRDGNKDAIWSKQNAGLTQREKKDLKEKLEEDAKVRYNVNYVSVLSSILCFFFGYET